MRSSALAFAVLVALPVGCQTTRPTARCAIVASPVGSQNGAEPPQLTIMGKNPVAEPARMSVSRQRPIHCGPKPLAFESPIDDLTAVWVGRAKGDDGQFRSDCPAFPSTLSAETPQIEEPPCGSTACPNQQVAFGQDGIRVHVLFYDDPSQHRSERPKEPPSGVCYYRVYSVSVAWDGKAPQ